jgi:hypothetical protein
MRARQVGTIVALAVSLTMVGCSDDDDGAPDTTTVPDGGSTTLSHGPLVTGTMTLDGVVTGTEPISIEYPDTVDGFGTCEELATGNGDLYTPPLPTTVADRLLTWRVAVLEYPGPGEFSADEIDSLEVEVRDAPDAPPVKLVPGPQTTAALEVRADGSGSLEFTGLAAPTGEALAGSVTWTCEG